MQDIFWQIERDKEMCLHVCSSLNSHEERCLRGETVNWTRHSAAYSSEPYTQATGTQHTTRIIYKAIILTATLFSKEQIDTLLKGV